ncbi:methyltransferase, TIGR04325 family [Ruegeria sp. R14_0]|uniref:methyltransferase, TIGR04325 family n=1 Tax=Ruegeria sp. R14_0 TaxID=2821100 RepID=UPI001ADD064B|nr:methyltransferase, TIGR04325 family [Ruegeria sp. R14_0]MBO9446710.1 methyltransferase, TIGR04325 family [Ruegeria sp. R14_0]
MAFRQKIKGGLGLLERHIGHPASAAWAHLMATGIRPPAMIGAYPDYATAMHNAGRGGYDHEDVAEVNVDFMSRKTVWDYPVMFWLKTIQRDNMHVLDAGGHLGTKYTAFRELCQLERVNWTVYDLPTTVRLARAAQQTEDLPSEIVFQDDLAQVGPVDLLLASGLLQYLDIPLAQLVGKLKAPPKHILLNKVATREGPTVVTLEKIGPRRVPYQIRNKAEFELSLSDMGYLIRDQWEIPSLSHVISTHPGLGPSTSKGYFLQRRD